MDTYKNKNENNAKALGNKKGDTSGSNTFLEDIEQMGLDQWSNKIKVINAVNTNERE